MEKTCRYFYITFEAMIPLTVILLFLNHPVWSMDKNVNYVSSTHTLCNPDIFEVELFENIRMREDRYILINFHYDEHCSRYIKLS